MMMMMMMMMMMIKGGKNSDAEKTHLKRSKKKPKRIHCILKGYIGEVSLKDTLYP